MTVTQQNDYAMAWVSLCFRTARGAADNAKNVLPKIWR